MIDYYQTPSSIVSLRETHLTLDEEEFQALLEIVYVYKQLQETHDTTNSIAYRLAKEISGI